MARTINMAVLVIVGFLAAALLQGTEAATYMVGNATGWSTPNSNTFYSTWAAPYNFMVGDVLVFNFVTGIHAVAIVNQSGYAACTPPNQNITTTGPASFTLNTTGQHYYICTFSGHCSAGQKLAISVTSTGSSSPPSPPGTVTYPPPPPPSSASSVVATFSVIFMSVVIGLLC